MQAVVNRRRHARLGGAEWSFLPHRQTATEGDPRCGRQSEEDRESNRDFVREDSFEAEDGRVDVGQVDDPEGDQQHRDDA